MTFRFNVDEFRVVLDQNAIRELTGGDDIKEALQIVGQLGEAAAKRFAPVDTGNLRRSLTHELGRRGIDQFVRVGTNVDYAAFQELGTRFHPAQPYLRPAIAELNSRFRG